MRPAALDDELLRALAERHGTPLFVYDAATVRARVAELGGFDRVRYAAKANANLALLRLVRSCGALLDAVSAGELRRALAAGFAPSELRYTADAFEPDALELARAHRIAVNAGSADALEQLAQGCADCELWLRVNPGFGHGHGRKVDTGGATSKHGIWHAELGAAIERARALGLAVRGLHVHIGSGSDFEHLARVARAMRALAPLAGSELRAISAGGGLPVPYRRGEARFELARYAELWRETRDAIAAQLGTALELEVEPGRFVVAEAGVLVARVLGRTRTSAVDFVLVDAGFNDLLRPSFYGAYHEVEAVGAASGELAPRVVAGPLCESGDVLTVTADGALDPRPLPDLARGELVCITTAGAYGASMSSGYNARPLAAEVLVDGGGARLVRRRQSIEQMLANERELM